MVGGRIEQSQIYILQHISGTLVERIVLFLLQSSLAINVTVELWVPDFSVVAKVSDMYSLVDS